MWRRLLTVLVSAALLSATAAAARAEARVALVIGNSAYRHTARLPNPINDAKDLGAALVGLGFEVSEAIDLDKRGLDDALRAFANRSATANVALVFYAGHGLQVSGQNYLLPVDARLESERDLDFETIRLEMILRQLETGRDGKTSLVFLDACRDNPLARNLARAMGARSIERGLAPVQSGAGIFIAFSTQPGNVARDGAGRNSPFAGALLRRIAEPDRNVSALMIEVRKDVMAATRGSQVPWDHSALTGEFYFNPWTGLVTGSVPPPPGGLHEERIRRLDEELGRRPPARP
jgi:uncharacterized caspase-like protein